MATHTSASHHEFSMYKLADAVYNNDYTSQESVASSLTSGTTRLERLKSIDFSTVDYITIGFGTNDYTGGIALKNDNVPEDTTTYMGATRHSLNQLIAKYPNAKIVLLTPIYRTWDDNVGAFDYARNNGLTLMDYGNALKEIAAEYDNNVYVYDGLYELGMNDTNRRMYFDNTDLVHPNIYGLRLYAYKLGKYIETLENQ